MEAHLEIAPSLSSLYGFRGTGPARPAVSSHSVVSVHTAALPTHTHTHVCLSDRCWCVCVCVSDKDAHSVWFKLKVTREIENKWKNYHFFIF